MDDAQFRSFIAIELPANVSAELEKLQNSLKSPQHSFVKWVPATNIHITLKFLGNIPPEKIGSVTTIIEKVAGNFSPFLLMIGEIGAFPSLKQPRVLWVGVKGETDKLLALQADLEENLARMGFRKEAKDFTPHLTLARLREKVSPTERRLFSELIMKKQADVHCQFKVNNISLMRSHLLPSGAVYTRLATIKLRG